VDTPLVTIILVNWNGRDDTLACLESLAALDYPRERLHLVMVDNGSEDGSVAAVRGRYPDVEVVANDSNLRFARANNQGLDIAASRGSDFVLLLNNDTEVDPAALGRMVAAARRDDAIGMVGPKIYHYQPPDMIWYAGGVISLWRGLVAHRGIRETDRGQYDRGGDTGYITACALLVSRRCLQAVGGLDEGYFIYGEDADWCQRSRKAGFRIVYEPTARVWHKVSSSSGGRAVAGGLTPFKVVHKTRSMARFFAHHASWYHWLTIPWFAIGYGVKAAVMMVASGNWGGLRALLTVFSRRRSP
jgi:GT2 family glycosyltransferase